MSAVAPQHVGLLCRAFPCACPPGSGHKHPDWIAYEAAARAEEERQHPAVLVDGETLTQRSPWRFDVPVVPAHVTALNDGEGLLWVRRSEGSDLWSRYHGDGTYSHTVPIGTVIQFGGFPLVECPDPRAAGAAS